MLPFNPEMSRMAAPGQCSTESTRTRSPSAARSGQHPARSGLAPRLLGARSGLATHPNCGPSPPKSPRVPRKRAALRGCYQFRLPGPGFMGTFSVEETEMPTHTTPHRQELPKRTRGGKEPGQGLAP